MAFKSSYHLQSCRLPKLGARGASVGGHNYKWPSSLPTTYSHAGYASWGARGVSVGGHDSKWPSSLPTTCSCAGYPGWEPEGHQLGVMTTNGLQVFLSPAVMPITQLGAGGESVGSHDYKWPSSLLTTYSCAS